ncbi:MAG: recombinase family protein [Faecalibacterium sp.]
MSVARKTLIFQCFQKYRYLTSAFERPDFKRMMQDIEKRKVNCIIVKDLSRFGRNYIETGRYLERIFPFMGVRFIAINDHYDSAEENDDKGRILIPFNNLINDTYCRDISLRVRSHLDVKRKEGRFIGSFAGYGYRKDPKDKNHLIIDEYAAGIVQEMNGNVKP